MKLRPPWRVKRGDEAPPIIILPLIEVTVQFHVPAAVAFPLRKRALYTHLIFGWGSSCGRSARFGEEENLFSLLGFELLAIIISVNNKERRLFNIFDESVGARSCSSHLRTFRVTGTHTITQKHS